MEKLQKELKDIIHHLRSINREEIELSSKDTDRPLQIKSTDVEVASDEKKVKRYILFQKDKTSPIQPYG